MKPGTDDSQASGLASDGLSGAGIGCRRPCGWAEIFPIVEARVRSDVCPLFFQLGTADVLAQTFQTAGFKDIVSERLLTVL